jgi:gluconokinase
MRIEGLRSCYGKVDGVVYFGRMLDKIRLYDSGSLPDDYHNNLGQGFDDRCAEFLRVPYEKIKHRTLEGGSDEEILKWCFEKGGLRKPSEIMYWNSFMIKRGWRDMATERLEARKQSSGMADRDDIQTFFDQIDVDEGRTPPAPPHT